MTQPRQTIFAEQKIQPSDLVLSIALLSTLLNSTSDIGVRQKHLKIIYDIETLQKTAPFFKHDPAITELLRARIDEILIEQPLDTFISPPIFLEKTPDHAANTVEPEHPKQPTLPPIKTIDGVEQSLDLDANVDVEPLVKKQKKSNTHPKNKEHINNTKRRSDETFIFYYREPTEKVDRNDVNIDMIIEIKEKREGILIWKNGNREIVVSQLYKRRLKWNENHGGELIEPVSLTLMHLSIEELIPIAEAGKLKPTKRKNLLPASDSPASPAPSSTYDWIESVLNTPPPELPLDSPRLEHSRSRSRSSSWFDNLGIFPVSPLHELPNTEEPVSKRVKKP